MTDSIGIEVPPAGAAVLVGRSSEPPGKIGGNTVIVSAGISDGVIDGATGINGTELIFGFEGAGTVNG